MTTLSDQQLHDLARLGAIARLRDIEQEAAALRKMFPGLKKPTEQSEASTPAAPKTRRGKGRMMSAAARKAQSEKMKAYWAKKRGEAPAPALEDAKKAEATGPTKATPVAPAKKKTAAKKRKKKTA